MSIISQSQKLVNTFLKKLKIEAYTLNPSIMVKNSIENKNQVKNASRKGDIPGAKTQMQSYFDY